MASRRNSGYLFALCLATFIVPCALSTQANSQADDVPEKHGRKYKAPPETMHIEVQVLKGFNQKPIMNAAVIFHPIKDGKDDGNLEVKTDPDGKAIIDVIPIGSDVRVQVIADGFATYAADYVIKEPSRQIVVRMQRPRAQVSTYLDDTSKPSDRAPGVQEPIRPKAKPKSPTVTRSDSAAQPTSAAPPTSPAPPTSAAPPPASSTETLPSNSPNAPPAPNAPTAPNASTPHP